jgi:hypothetical protein
MITSHKINYDVQFSINPILKNKIEKIINKKDQS